MDKLAIINKYLRDNKLNKLHEKRYHLIDTIYDIYINGNIIETTNDFLLNVIGNYYKKQKKYDEMIKYYKMAIDKSNLYAMCNLGSYYKKQKKI